MSNYGICIHSLIALRELPSEKSELVSQLLFGENYTLYEKQDKWLKIKNTADAYEGWIDAKLHTPLTENDFTEISKANFNVCQKPITLAEKVSTKTNMLLPMGSILLNQNNNSIEINTQVFILEHVQTIEINNNIKIAEFARLFINTPYLWGGKSIMGIDCSGLVQVCCSAAGIQIPRDAIQQVNLGQSLSFIDEAQAGDLAFFDDDEGNIVHVGIISGNRKIIHAFGVVREDPIDHQGIYNPETSKYSHKLRIIKRLNRK